MAGWLSSYVNRLVQPVQMYTRCSLSRPLYIRSQMNKTTLPYLYSSFLLSFIGKTKSETNQEQLMPTINPTSIHAHSTFRSTIRGPFFIYFTGILLITYPKKNPKHKIHTKPANHTIRSILFSFIFWQRIIFFKRHIF